MYFTWIIQKVQIIKKILYLAHSIALNPPLRDKSRLKIYKQEVHEPHHSPEEKVLSNKQT